MTSPLDSEQESPTELERRRSFRRRLWSLTGCYLVLSVALSIWGPASATLRVLLTVLSVAVVAVIIVIVILRARVMDEYQRKLLFPGLAVGFTVVVFAAITLGALSSAGVAVPNAGWPVAILGILSWAATNLVVGAPLA